MGEFLESVLCCTIAAMMLSEFGVTGQFIQFGHRLACGSVVGRYVQQRLIPANGVASGNILRRHGCDFHSQFQIFRLLAQLLFEIAQLDQVRPGFRHECE